MISVHTSYGHRFYQDGEDETCLTCGATYQLIETPDDEWVSHAYVNIRGDEPNECTGDTGMVHGYPGERCCLECENSDGPCSHETHDCNCLQCDS